MTTQSKSKLVCPLCGYFQGKIKGEYNDNLTMHLWMNHDEVDLAALIVKLLEMVDKPVTMKPEFI